MPLAAFPKCYLDALCVDHTMAVLDWIHMAAEQLGDTGLIEGLEFYAGFTPLENREELLFLRRCAEESGLTIPMMCYSPDFTRPDPIDRAVEVERAKRAIEATALLGGRYCRVLSGQRRPEITMAEGIHYAARCIESLLPYAEEQGIVLILENHYKDGFWEYPELAQKRDAFLELLASIPETPYFGVNYDPSNAIVAGEDPIALLEAIKSRVVTMHASDRYFEGGTLKELQQRDAHPQQGYATFLQHGVIGQGMNDYDAIFSILRSAGFQGWISIEDGQDARVGMEHLKLSARFLREKMKAYGIS